jgi:hypothetical protein
MQPTPNDTVDTVNDVAILNIITQFESVQNYINTQIPNNSLFHVQLRTEESNIDVNLKMLLV